MIIVTGAAGFIGSNLISALAAKGEKEIIACDYLGDAEKWRNLAKHEIADVVEPNRLFEFLESHNNSVDIIFHMGAISSTVETNVDLILENNFRLSFNLWKWGASNQVPFIYASSAATYGGRSESFVDDDSCQALAKLKPMNAYAWSKHIFDMRVARMLVEGTKAPPHWAGLKFFNVYGPNEYHKGSQQSVVAQFYKQISETGEAKLFQSHDPDYEDGEQLRDFIWVGDCVDIVLWLAENSGIGGLFNCGTGKARSFNDLAKAIFTILDKEPNITYIPTPENIRNKYQYFTEANMSRLRSVGYKDPSTSLEDGIEKYIVEHLSSEDPYR